MIPPKSTQEDDTMTTQPKQPYMFRDRDYLQYMPVVASDQFRGRLHECPICKARKPYPRTLRAVSSMGWPFMYHATQNIGAPNPEDPEFDSLGCIGRVLYKDWRMRMKLCVALLIVVFMIAFPVAAVCSSIPPMFPVVLGAVVVSPWLDPILAFVLYVIGIATGLLLVHLLREKAQRRRDRISRSEDKR